MQTHELTSCQHVDWHATVCRMECECTSQAWNSCLASVSHACPLSIYHACRGQLAWGRHPGSMAQQRRTVHGGRMGRVPGAWLSVQPVSHCPLLDARTCGESYVLVWKCMVYAPHVHYRAVSDINNSTLLHIDAVTASATTFPHLYTCQRQCQQPACRMHDCMQVSIVISITGYHNQAHVTLLCVAALLGLYPFTSARPYYCAYNIRPWERDPSCCNGCKLWEFFLHVFCCSCRSAIMTMHGCMPQSTPPTCALLRELCCRCCCYCCRRHCCYCYCCRRHCGCCRCQLAGTW